MKRDSRLILIVLVCILVISNLVFGYMLFFHKSGPGFSGSQNMQLTNEQIQNVTSFFSSTTDATQISSYCMQNMEECFYYCRNIDPGNEICGQLNLTSQTGTPPQK